MMWMMGHCADICMKKGSPAASLFVTNSYEVLNGFEPMIRELQSHALPLGYSTNNVRFISKCYHTKCGSVFQEFFHNLWKL